MASHSQPPKHRRRKPSPPGGQLRASLATASPTPATLSERERAILPHAYLSTKEDLCSLQFDWAKLAPRLGFQNPRSAANVDMGYAEQAARDHLLVRPSPCCRWWWWSSTSRPDI